MAYFSLFYLELFVVACLGVVSHFRFHRLLNRSRDSNHSRSITHKIRYFQELNLILTVVLFVTSMCFIILSADGLTGKKSLNAHKFSADFMICNSKVFVFYDAFCSFLFFYFYFSIFFAQSIPAT